MNIRTLSCCYGLVLMFFNLGWSQNSRDALAFSEMTQADIPGAPRLGLPQLITGSSAPVVSGGSGLAAPALWDMNGDQLKDLLIGEFATGIDVNGRYVGNFIRLYKNEGTETAPQYSGRFDYARPPFEYQSLANGTPYSVDQYCCIGFTPQFIDLNHDGKMDMITGQYQGEVTWFRGTEAGFLPGEAVTQSGDPRGANWQKKIDYWLYSSASFGDLTGDGLPDLITGGASLRVSRNEGTSAVPQFGLRQLLLDVDGNPLKVHEYTPEEKKAFQKYVDAFGSTMPIGGNDHLSPFVIDWDNDGVLDLLVTNTYASPGLDLVDFFRGQKINGEHRFQKKVAMLSSKDGGKFFPGSAPRIFVDDWNGDGIKDLLIGTSVSMMNGQFNGRFSWNWEETEKIPPAGKDPANNYSEADWKRYKEYYKDKLPDGIDMDDFVTIRRVGYVYLLLGMPVEHKTARPLDTKKNGESKKSKKGK